MSIRIWTETITIPSYSVGEKEKNPMFFEKRVYQGSSGKVYPHPLIDKIEDEKKDQDYLIVFLENEYIQVQIMPELGGRIYRAIDKTNDYDFVYYNQVIKPALVGLTGPWISGGIEFNWPQHHRPNSFGSVEYWLDDSKDDIKTVWMSELDRMYGTKVSTGISLREKAARIEIHCELYNPTAEAQTFLWWANPAVAVHEATQSIFPPDVHAVMDHGKRAVSRFPIASGTYYKMDYSQGVDISRYKNIPVPTSYMAYHSDYDFVGGYDWNKEAGILHVADHHISPGKKQWTWGCGDFGRAWDRNLTDEDGPYIELMTGVYTDNQPDFTWLAPYSGKSFTQYFMPYKKVGEVSSASKDIIAGFTLNDGLGQIKIYASRPLPEARIQLCSREGEVFLDEAAELSPTAIFERQVALSRPAHHLKLTVTAEAADCVEYEAPAPKIEKMPDPAQAIAPPPSLPNTEALLLAGLHLEQYRHATFAADSYYREGLKRDAGDIRLNNAYGCLLLKRCQFSEALDCFAAAKATATRHSPNPYDGEVFFNLGKAYDYLGEEDKAFDAYYKACWSDAYKTQGYTKLAQLSARRGKLAQAAAFAEEALYTGMKNMKARAAATVLLRMMDQREAAVSSAQLTLEFDPLDFCALRELANLGQKGTMASYPAILCGGAHNYMSLAQTYAELGQYDEAISILDEYINAAASPYAMTMYLRAYYLEKAADGRAAEAWKKAATAARDFCFPNMPEEYLALRQAVEKNPDDARAPYYLGCFLYDKGRYDEAAETWENSAALDASFPTVFRNLALYYANKQGCREKALASLEKAFHLNEQDARVFYELCDLYRKVALPPEELRQKMEAHRELVAERDDLSVAYAEVLNACAAYEQALDLLTQRNFHPWEGGEGKVPTQHIRARLGLARQLLKEGQAEAALRHLEKASVYEANFGEGKLQGAQENNIDYTMGLAHRALGNEEAAKACLARAAVGLTEVGSALYYNDQPPHMIFYQGLALRELGQESEARSRFHKLLDYGEKNLFVPQVMDYFAVSMPDFMVFESSLDDNNQTHCYYMMALGYWGLGRKDEARQAFVRALQITPNHFAVLEHFACLDG